MGTTYTWTELDTSVTKPSGRYLQSSILHNEKMVMFGGSGRCSSGDPNNCEVELDDVWTLSLNPGPPPTTTTTVAPPITTTTVAPPTTTEASCPSEHPCSQCTDPSHKC